MKIGSSKQVQPEASENVENDLEPDFSDIIEEFEGFQDERVLLNLEDLFMVCRICLRNTENLSPLFEKVKDEDFSLSELVCETFSPLNIETPNEELYPQRICKDCQEKLMIAHQFKQDLLESQELMLKILETPLEIQESAVSAQDVIENYENLEEEEFFENSGECQEEEQNLEKPDPHDFQIQPSRLPRIDQSKVRAEKCYLCNINFQSTPEEHFQVHHKKIGLTECSICQFETEFPWFLNLHYQLHADDIKLCQNCGSKFENRQKYYSHVRKCRKRSLREDERIRYKCQYCEANYLTKRSLDIHEVKHGKNIEVSFLNSSAI